MNHEVTMPDRIFPQEQLVVVRAIEFEGLPELVYQRDWEPGLELPYGHYVIWAYIETDDDLISDPPTENMKQLCTFDSSPSYSWWYHGHYTSMWYNHARRTPMFDNNFAGSEMPLQVPQAIL